MPWARIPCDKLAFVEQFGYTFEKEDGRNLWYRDADGKLHCVDKYAPRLWFESAGEAAQAGCIAVRISSESEAAEFRAAKEELDIQSDGSTPSA